MKECDQKVWNVFDQFGITIACSDTYFLEVGARVSLKVATKRSIRGKKKLWKSRYLDHFSKVKTEERDQGDWPVSDTFGIISLAQLHIIWKWVHLFHSDHLSKLLLMAKNLWKSIFLVYFSKAKTEQCDQKKLSLSDKFGMLISGLDTYFLEVSAHALLKVATETYFNGKKSENLAFLGYFFRSKNGGVWILFFSIILESSFLVQIHTFWKSVNEFFVHNIFVAIGSSE